MGHNYCCGRERRRVEILKKRGSVLALMRSKRKLSLLISLTLFLLIVPFASADFGAPATTYNSRWAYISPIIDGTISAGEWANATVRDFTFDMRSGSGISAKNVSARFFIKNDYTNIYAAIQIFNIDFNQLNSTALWDAVALFFEDNHTHILQSGDQGEEITTHPTESPCYTNHDMYYDGSSWVKDVGAGKTEDGALAWNHTGYPTQGANGNYTVEMQIPLAGSDGDAYDLAITTLPKTIGYKIWFYEGNEGTHGVYPDNQTIIQNSLEIKNATTFGNLILHPLYTLTILPTTGGTTSPGTGAYQYGWGEMATVSASPNAGYLFDHWELDGGYAGSSSPILVTMDMNHTLKAFFKSAPPIVGGMAAPIAIPINEPSLLTPLIWLASAIIFPIALTVVFVKRGKKKL